MSNHDSTKRIPKSLGTGTKLFGRYTLTDLAVGLFPGVAVILVTQVLLPSSLTLAGYSPQAFALPLALCGIAVGGLFVYLTPAYTTSIDWLETVVGFYGSDQAFSHDAAKELTNVERVYPDQDAIERTDGTLVAVVQVMPPTMALATRERWESQAESFQDFLNTVVEYPIQIYSTTQEFPAEDYLSRYEDRLDDPDVENNPQLASLIENYVSWYRTELEERQMTIRDHYIVVPVTRSEVQFEQDSLTRKLSALPLVGLFVRVWFGPQQAARQAAMTKTLEERCRRLQSGVREIEGCSAERVSTADAVRLLEEYWSGDSVEYGDMDQVLRTRPIVRGGRSQ